MARSLDYVVVGVDIGMTCTGADVAAAAGVAIWSSDMSRPVAPVVIQRWPMNENNIAYKVPTALIYRAGRSRPCSWGFGCSSPQNSGYGLGAVDYFKYFLDKDELERYFRDRPGGAPDIDDVRKWFRDFLHALYERIIAYFEEPMWQLDWLSTKVEYVFGLPTLWKERDELVRDFKHIVAQAGFVQRVNCNVTFGLTEAEASAVYTAKSLEHNYKEGDVMLVCDAGGGTTDVCVLRVRVVKGEIVELEAVDEPRALNAGSVQIDDAFEEYAMGRLTALRLEHPQLPDHTAHDMARGAAFQSVKLAFGTPTSVAVERIPVPDLPNKTIELPREILKNMFDRQIQKIVETIDLELRVVGETVVRYLVLSGGLGSSRYVREEMEGRYDHRGISVLYPTNPIEPPLAGCKGLVIDLMQRKDHLTSVVATRRIGTSYGILCSDRYHSSRHSEQPFVESQLDRKKYVTNQIDWFIRKGEILQKDKPIPIKCSRVLGLDNPNKTWTARLVRSQLERQDLPGHLDPDDSEVQIYGQLSSNLGPDLDITRRRRIFSSKYVRVEYEISVSIKQENLDFEAKLLGEGTGAPQQLNVEYFDDHQSEEAEDSGSRFQNEIFRHLT